MLRRRTFLADLAGGGIPLSGCTGVRRDGSDRPTETKTTERTNTTTEFATNA